MKLPEKVKKMSPDEQRAWVKNELNKAEKKFMFLRSISQRLAQPGGKLKLEDWDRPDLIQLKDN